MNHFDRVETYRLTLRLEIAERNGRVIDHTVPDLTLKARSLSGGKHCKGRMRPAAAGGPTICAL